MTRTRLRVRRLIVRVAGYRNSGRDAQAPPSEPGRAYPPRNSALPGKIRKLASTVTANDRHCDRDRAAGLDSSPTKRFTVIGMISSTSPCCIGRGRSSESAAAAEPPLAFQLNFEGTAIPFRVSGCYMLAGPECGTGSACQTHGTVGPQHRRAGRIVRFHRRTFLPVPALPGWARVNMTRKEQRNYSDRRPGDDNCVLKSS